MVRTMDGEKMRVREFCLREVGTSRSDEQMRHNLPLYSASNSLVKEFSWLTSDHLHGRHKHQNEPPLQPYRLHRL